MISFEQALETVLSTHIEPRHETVTLSRALGRVLAERVVARHDWPPFDKSAMDGYALPAGDTSTSYRVVEQLPAGATPARRLNAGECAKIMTGAMMPREADRVVPVEMTEEHGGVVRILEQSRKDNVCRKGENCRTGEQLLARGALIGPAEIGTIASAGISEIKAARAPALGLVTTGSELQEAGQVLAPGKIFNSNGPQLAAQIASMRLDARQYGTVADKLGPLVRVLEQALDECDVVLMSGGVSMGDWDFVPEAMRRVGVELLFEKIAVKPGKPTVFGHRDGRFLFGLPGNPVSTFVLFEVLVKPFLYHLMGHAFEPVMLRGELTATVSRRAADRSEFRPVRYRDGRVDTIQYHGSAHLNALCHANALLRVPRGEERIEKGTVVQVRRF